MNYIGKILVILNLVFVLVLAGFLVVYSATKDNWYAKYKNLQDEMKSAEIIVGAEGRSLQNLANENKKLAQEQATARQEVTDLKTVNEAQKATYDAKLADSDMRAKDADLTAQRALAEKERHSKENQGLLVVIKQRDEYIVNQQADLVKYRNEAVAHESTAKNNADRLAQALERNAELERDLVKKSSGPGGGDAIPARGRPNPPTVYVEGKVESIHPQDADLVQLTVGSDKGLSKNQTLEVYRFEPKAQYLGMIRIVDVTPHQAVGRLERVGTANRTPLRVGDTVASSLTRN